MPHLTDDMVERAAIAAANNSMRPGYAGRDWPQYSYGEAAKERWRKIARLMLEAALHPIPQ
jgi:hypothetical protein